LRPSAPVGLLKKYIQIPLYLSIKLYLLGEEKLFLCLTSENTTGFRTPRLSPLPGQGIKSGLVLSDLPSKIQFLTSLGTSILLYLITVTTLGKGHKLAHWFSRFDLYNQRPPKLCFLVRSLVWSPTGGYHGDGRLLAATDNGRHFIKPSWFPPAAGLRGFWRCKFTTPFGAGEPARPAANIACVRGCDALYGYSEFL